MNALHRKLLPALAFVVIGALAAPTSAAPVDCAKPSGHEQQRACAAAAKGVGDLRQFIQRTRGIYILYIQDFERAVPSVAATSDQTEAPKLARR